MYVTGAYAIKNGFYFACYSATVVHCGLFYYRQVWSGFKGLFSKKHRDKYYTDVHNRLMRAYPETPQWWFVALYVTALALAAFALRKFLPDTPIWVSLSYKVELTSGSWVCLRNFDRAPCTNGHNRFSHWLVGPVECHL